MNFNMRWMAEENDKSWVDGNEIQNNKRIMVSIIMQPLWI